MKSASRSTMVVAGTAEGFVVAGPAGAIAGAVAGGAAADGTITGVGSAINGKFTPYGQIASWDAAIDGKTGEENAGGAVGIVMAPLVDGVCAHWL